MVIDNEIFGSYSLCKYKSFLKYIRRVGTISDYEEFQRQRKIEYKRKVNMELLKNCDEINVLKERFVNNAVFQSGKELLSGVTINNKDIEAHIDVLEKVMGESASESFSYIPYKIVAENKIGNQEKLLLAFIGYVLGKAQKRAVWSGWILYGEPIKRSKIDLTKYYHTVDTIIKEIGKFSDKDKKPRLILNKHCLICEFREDCEKEARDKDDLSLLRGIKEKEIEAHNKKGFFTVNQLSYTFRSRKPSKRTKNPANLHNFALQSLSLRENIIYIHGDPKLPTAETMIYFDIEGLPHRDFYYLIGVTMVSENNMTHHVHWADIEQDQELIFSEFLNKFNRIPNSKFYHFGAYDIKVLKKMKGNLDKELGETIETIIANSVNVLSIVYSHIYFPSYSNSLKDIGRVL